MDRRPITLLAALILALALCAPAWAQSEESETTGDDPAAVEAQGTDDGSGEGSDGEVLGSGSDNCDPNYEGVCLDQEGDYDCEGGSGDGPNFVEGPFDSVGDDPFELDENGEGTAQDDNGDGTACEDSSSGDEDSGSTPSGGVDSGFGGMAPKPNVGPVTPLVIGGVAATVLLGLGVMVVRRRA